MSTLLANIKRTTHAQLDAYKAWNVDAIVAPRADDCTYRYLPESMNQPTMDNDQFREYFSTIIPLLEGFDFTLADEVYDEQARTSVCHGFSTARSPVGPYRMEVFLLMKFNESGEKIVKIEEMMDSAYMADLLAKISAAQSQGQSAQ